MWDLLVVELVEDVLVDVLDVHPETVLPHALLDDDLGATPVHVRAVLERLRPELPADAMGRLVAAGSAGYSGGFSVADLVGLVESHRGRRAAGPAAPAVLPGQRAVPEPVGSPR
jgi:hypothetical protein